MNAVGRIGSYIYRGVGTVSGPFHPFGGAIDIIVVQQPDGTFKSSPWYVRFGKFQGVLKNKRNLIKIEVNGAESPFNMYLAHTGQAYFLREVADVVGDSEETAEVYNLSSGDEADDDDGDDDDKVKLPLKSKSCNYDGPAPPIVGKPGILGFVFGGRSVRESKLEEVGSSEEKLVVDSDLILETPLVASPTLRYLDEKEQDFRESNNVDDYCEENDAILVDNGSTSTVFSIASEGSGEVDICVEPQAQDSKQEMLSVPESVENVADQVDLWSIGTSQEGSSTGSLVQDESKITMGDDFEKPQSTSVVLQPEMEEEQFSFSDLDDCKPAASSSGGSNSPHTVKADGKEICPVEDSKVLSEPVDIEREHGISGEEIERLVESLPIMRLQSIDDMDASPCKPMSQSFDPCSSTSKWDLREDEPCSRGLDAESVAESSPNLKAFTHVVANPEVVELSFCKHLLREEMGSEAASQAFNSEKLDMETFASLGPSVLENDKLILKIGGCYFPWEAAAPIILGVVSFGTAQVFEPKGMIAVDRNEKLGDVSAPEGGSWKLWPFSLGRSRNDSEGSSKDAGEPEEKQKEKPLPRPVKKMVRALAPTSEQLASLDLKEGMNTVNFTFSTNIVDARIYLWKWNTRIVVSDVDGTITRSDVLGQFMPLVGIDWSQTGVTHLFSAVKENGYQLMFLSARAISQASITRQFLVNLKQDGKALPDGPVVISPDGVFPSLYREVIRRAPHEFKISCLAEIRSLFPPEHNPFYAGFGNRDTDEISYLEVGIPRGKIFTINPKGQVAVNRRVDTRSYTNLHALVNGMFPATTTSSEREDFNTWNFWKLPPPPCM